jgi:hypothetical protein
MADAADSKSVVRKDVEVQVLSPAPITSKSCGLHWSANTNCCGLATIWQPQSSLSHHSATSRQCATSLACQQGEASKAPRIPGLMLLADMLRVFAAHRGLGLLHRGQCVREVAFPCRRVLARAIAERNGAETPVREWHARLARYGCRSRQADFVVTGTERGRMPCRRRSMGVRRVKPQSRRELRVASLPRYGRLSFDWRGRKEGSRATLLYKSQFFVDCRRGRVQRHRRC